MPALISSPHSGKSEYILRFGAPDKKLLPEIQCAVKIIGKDDTQEKGNIAEPQHADKVLKVPRYRGWMGIVIRKKAEQPA